MSALLKIEGLCKVYDDDSREQEFKFHIYGADISKVAIEATQQNVKSAGLSKYISLEVRDFEQTAEVPESDYTKQLKAEGQTAPSLMLITNPPYGRRLFTDVPTFYRMMGSVLKKQFQGAEAWIISSEEKVTVKNPRTGLKTEVEPFDYIGLKPSVKIDLNNGGIDCQLRKYELFSGKFDAFRAEGKSLEKKTADEKEDSKFEREHKPAGKRPFKKEGKDGKFEKKEGKFGRKDGKPDRKDSKPRRTKDAGTERSYTVRKDGSIVAKDKFEKKDRKPFGKDSKKPFRKKEEGEKKPAPRKRREFDPNRPMFSPDTDMSKLVLDYSQPAHNDEKKD